MVSKSDVLSGMLRNQKQKQHCKNTASSKHLNYQPLILYQSIMQTMQNVNVMDLLIRLELENVVINHYLVPGGVTSTLTMIVLTLFLILSCHNFQDLQVHVQKVNLLSYTACIREALFQALLVVTTLYTAKFCFQRFI